MLTFGSKYSYLVILSVGFALGFYICTLFNGCGSYSPSVAQIAIEKPEKIKKQVEVFQAIYQCRIDSLGDASKKLQSTLQTTQAALDKAKKKNLVLQTQVYDLIDRQTVASTNRDTATLLIDCDTLKTKVDELMIASNDKDSINEVETLNLEQQVHNKDSTIDIQTTMYQSLKSSFNQSIDELQLQTEQNRLLKKQIKRQKFKNTFRTIGLILLAGFGTHYITNH